MRLNQNTLDLACLAGLLALAGGGAAALLYLARADASRIDFAQRALAAARNELQAVQAVEDRLKQALLAHQSGMDALLRRLPESERLGEWLAGLDTLAQAVSVRLSRVEPGEPVRETLCGRTPLRITCDGEYVNLYRLILGLEHAERLVRVDSATISRAALTEPCHAELSCSVYVR